MLYGFQTGYHYDDLFTTLFNKEEKMTDKNFIIAGKGQYKTEEEAVKAAKQFSVQYRQPYTVFKAIQRTVDKTIEAVEMEKVEA